MFYVTVGYLRYGFKVDTRKEAEKLFDKACAEYAYAHIVLRNAEGRTIKERFSKSFLEKNQKGLDKLG